MTIFGLLLKGKEGILDRNREEKYEILTDGHFRLLLFFF